MGLNGLLKKIFGDQERARSASSLGSPQKRDKPYKR